LADLIHPDTHPIVLPSTVILPTEKHHPSLNEELSSSVIFPAVTPSPSLTDLNKARSLSESGKTMHPDRMQMLNTLHKQQRSKNVLALAGTFIERIQARKKTREHAARIIWKYYRHYKLRTLERLKEEQRRNDEEIERMIKEVDARALESKPTT
jgi:hypothetical protein